MAFNLSRNTTFLVSPDGGTTKYKLPILDGYSFSQTTNTQDISVSEAGTAPIRGQKSYNTSLAPVDVSFSTYARPFVDTAATNFHDCNEKILWNALISSVEDTGVTSDATNIDFSFANSNVNNLLELTLYFHTDGVLYTIGGFTMNSVSIDFGIDSIATLSWSGQGTSLTPTSEAAPAATALGTAPADADFIKNKLSTIALTGDVGGGSTTYSLALTGGSIEISNNITFLTPEELGVVNRPIGSFTGTRSISGNVTCYLKTAATESLELFTDMLSTTGLSDTNPTADLSISLGGASAPNITFDMPTAKLNIPTVNAEEVFTTQIDFMGEGSTGIEANDEITVTYVGATSTTRT